LDQFIDFCTRSADTYFIGFSCVVRCKLLLLVRPENALGAVGKRELVRRSFLAIRPVEIGSADSNIRSLQRNKEEAWI
jgi:hypothetical protein